MKLFLASAFAACTIAASKCEKSGKKLDELNECTAKIVVSQTDSCANANAALACASICASNQKECDDAKVAYSAVGSDCVLKCEVNGCFPATSTVELESGKSINLDQLQLGDKVRVGPSEFSEVYFFSTEMAETTSKFVKLVTDSGAVTMTQGHYLYVNGALKVASDVQVGDNIVLGNGTHVAVNEVTSVWAPGLYNPHTLHGDIVVDGIHTSTYTDAVHPTLAHALLSPLRTMYSAGISFGKEFRDTTKSMPSWLRKIIQA
jgi:hypothetical protein